MTKIKFLSVILLVASAFLTGCAKEPPMCAAPEAIDSVRTLLVNSAKELKGNSGLQQIIESDDPQKLGERFFDGVKVVLNRIVSGGYQSDARMRSCNAELVVETPAGDSFSRDIDYRLQMQEGQDNFVITVKDAQPLITRINTDQAVFYRDKRFNGDWTGTYACEGIDGQAEGPQGPFSMPVTMVVTEGRGRLERTTKGGGVEILDGTLDLGNRTLWVRGHGKNGPDDTWTANFNGSFVGMQYTGKGQIKADDGDATRNCTLTLVLPSN